MAGREQHKVPKKGRRAEIEFATVTYAPKLTPPLFFFFRLRPILAGVKAGAFLLWVLGAGVFA